MTRDQYKTPKEQWIKKGFNFIPKSRSSPKKGFNFIPIQNPRIANHEKPTRSNHNPSRIDSTDEAYLVKLLRNSSADYAGVKGGDIDSNQSCEGFGSTVRLDHLPDSEPLELVVLIICVLPP